MLLDTMDLAFIPSLAESQTDRQLLHTITSIACSDFMHILAFSSLFRYLYMFLVSCCW